MSCSLILESTPINTMQTSNPAGFFRLFSATAAALVLSIAPAMAAAPNAIAKLGSKSFGNGVSLSATSVGSVIVSPQYTYNIQGTCEGTEDLAFVRKGTSFAALLNSFSKGIGAGLVGVAPPPVPPSKSSIVEVPVKGSRRVAKLGVVTFNAILRCEVQPTGKVLFEVKQVQFATAKGPLKGVIRMGAGSVLTVSAPPRVVCKLSGVNVNEDAGTVNVVISRNIALTGSVTVNYTTEDGKAKAGADYVATTGSV
ncbi:MAG: hypothetical protein MUF13_03915, partial [Akkermansiaceae bacterium]|nr:hypothetical protein [Akkermansiaceae bacterium]